MIALNQITKKGKLFFVFSESTMTAQGNLKMKNGGQLKVERQQTDVAQAFEVCQSITSHLRNRFQDTENVKRRCAQGRPPSTSSEDERYFSILEHHGRCRNATRQRSEFAAATGQLFKPKPYDIDYTRHCGIMLTTDHKAAQRTWY